ncbi:MAG TPA: GntR family transcriptional regulator [Streptosporangiaceae bacterium]|nr:GntR family transcriptional regulator [Streptosporangiaceae bacterium]
MPREQPAAGLGPLAGPAESLADQAVAAIRAAVRDGTLQAGQLYSASQVASYLGVSRSPVREALMRLAEAGMVGFERNRGFRIVAPGAADIAEIFQLRLLLEVPAARRAAARPTAGLTARLTAELDQMRAAAARGDERSFMHHDQRLHRIILEAAGNARLTVLVDNLRDATRTLGASTAGRSRGLADIAAAHLPVIEAIAAGDPAAAGVAMSRHIAHTGRLLVAQAAAAAPGSGDRDRDSWPEAALS